jgi:transcriptional regulator with XRE-family HTH domain
VSFVDIAGIVRGASVGEGLGNKFLANIREADAICQVVRVFVDDDVTHVEGKVSPAGDIETIETELVLADLQTMEKAVPRLEKEARIVKEKRAAYENALAVQKCLEAGDTLYAGHAAYGVDLAEARSLQLLTAKPFIYVFNLDEDQLTDAALQATLRESVAPADCVFLSAKLEADLAELDDAEARELLESVGVTEPGLDQLAHVGFHTLGLQTYLTAGPKESRAWTIRAGLDRAAGGRGHPHRLPARLHQGRDRVVRRPGRCRVDGGRAGGRPRADRRQGLRHGRRRRRRVPLQRLGQVRWNLLTVMPHWPGSVQPVANTSPSEPGPRRDVASGQPRGPCGTTVLYAVRPTKRRHPAATAVTDLHVAHGGDVTLRGRAVKGACSLGDSPLISSIREVTPTHTQREYVSKRSSLPRPPAGLSGIRTDVVPRRRGGLSMAAAAGEEQCHSVCRSLPPGFDRSSTRREPGGIARVAVSVSEHRRRSGKPFLIVDFDVRITKMRNMPAPSPYTSPEQQADLQRLGARLRERRKALGVTVVACAEAAGVSRVTMHRIEAGNPSVTIGAYINVAAALGLHLVVPILDAPSAEPATITVGDYPGLRTLAWQTDAGVTITETEALNLYERGWRHLNHETLTDHEKAFVQHLADTYSNGRLLV